MLLADLDPDQLRISIDVIRKTDDKMLMLTCKNSALPPCDQVRRATVMALAKIMLAYAASADIGSCGSASSLSLEARRCRIAAPL